MPMWTVARADGMDEQVEADALATESGALVALAEDGLLLRAWAPGQWQTVGQVTGVAAHPAGKATARGPVVVGMPRR
jgi:muconolactone delta-isomerase